MHERIAQIKSTFLGVEDHGIFTSVLYVDYGGSGQGIGTYSLDEYDSIKKARFGTAFGMDFIIKTLWVAGVTSWEDLPGVHILVLTEDDNWNSKVVGIRSTPIVGKRTFIFSELADKHYPELAGARK